MVKVGALQEPVTLSASAGVALTAERIMHATIAETKMEIALQQQPHQQSAVAQEEIG